MQLVRSKKFNSNKELLYMILPCIIFYIVFYYVPIYGVIIAFKDFSFVKGILGSKWIGLDNFIFMFQGQSFTSVFKNTIFLGILKLVIGFPIPILFALMLNEINNIYYKKFVQTVSYLPYFLSWVILGSVFMQFFSIDGPLNSIIGALGLQKISFFTSPEWFRIMLLGTYVWKVFGWNSIIYIAAITSIDPQIYEAAKVDGAGKLRRVFYITLPSLAPVITVMFILSAGNVIKDDFDQIFNLYNSSVYKTADVIATYAYRQGIVEMNYSYSTAVDLFKNLIALILVYIVNSISKKINEYGLW